VNSGENGLRYALAAVSSLQLSPLATSLAAHGLAHGNALGLAFGRKVAFSFDRAQDAVSGYFFAKPLEQALLRLARF